MDQRMAKRMLTERARQRDGTPSVCARAGSRGREFHGGSPAARSEKERAEGLSALVEELESVFPPFPDHANSRTLQPTIGRQPPSRRRFLGAIPWDVGHPTIAQRALDDVAKLLNLDAVQRVTSFRLACLEAAPDRNREGLPTGTSLKRHNDEWGPLAPMGPCGAPPERNPSGGSVP